ncbi:hypothetical protein BG000_006158 [Podila horticola]|nr:hypothetical protein BG000_006158 [Podila horticola]
MNNSKATYISNKNTGVHDLTIRIQWKPEMDDSENYTAFESKLENFGLSLKKNFGRYDYFCRLQNGKCLCFGAIALKTSSTLQLKMDITAS